MNVDQQMQIVTTPSTKPGETNCSLTSSPSTSLDSLPAPLNSNGNVPKHGVLPSTTQKSRRKQSTPSRCLSPPELNPATNQVPSSPLMPLIPSSSILDIPASRSKLVPPPIMIPPYVQVVSPDSTMKSPLPPPEKPIINLEKAVMDNQELARQWYHMYMQNMTLHQMLRDHGFPLPPPLPFYASPLAPTPPSLPFFPTNFAISQPPYTWDVKLLDEPLVKKLESFRSKDEPIIELPPKALAQKPTFECSICGYQLASRTYLKKHLAKKHGINQSTSTETRLPELKAEVLQSEQPKPKRIRLKLKIPKKTTIEEPVGSTSTPKGAESEEPEVGSTVLRINDTPVLKSLLKNDLANPGGPVSHKSLLDISETSDTSFSSAEESPNVFKTLPPPEGTPSNLDLDLHCMFCNREYCSKYFFRKHLMKVHKLSSLDYLMHVRTNYPDIYARYAQMPVGFGGEDELLPQSLLEVLKPARQNWCTQCKKNFCNKYFFRNHMIKRHGDNPEGYAPAEEHAEEKRTKPVFKCDVCQKNYSTRYFLKVHRKNKHGIDEKALSMVNNDQVMQGSVAGFIFGQTADPENVCGPSLENEMEQKPNGP